MTPPRELAELIYALWRGVPMPERSRARWVMPQAVLDALVGQPVPLPVCILGKPVRVDDTVPGIRIEQEAPPWGSTMTAWMWP